MLSPVVAYLIQEVSFFPAIFVLLCQPLGEAVIRICNLCTLPTIGKLFYFYLLEPEEKEDIFPKDYAKIILTRGRCQLLRHPH